MVYIKTLYQSIFVDKTELLLGFFSERGQKETSRESLRQHKHVVPCAP